MPEGRPQEGEIWSNRQQMYHVIEVSARWVCGTPTGGFEDSLFPLDTFIRNFHYIGTPAQPYQHPIAVDSYWRLRPGVERNFGADNETFTVYAYQNGEVSVVDHDDYDRYRYTFSEADFRRLFRVGGPLPDDDLSYEDDGPALMSEHDDEGEEADTPEPDMEVLRVILANIPPGMTLERVSRALAPEYQEAIEDLREDGTLVQFSQNGTLLVPWDQVNPTEPAEEPPSLWERLDASE